MIRDTNACGGRRSRHFTGHVFGSNVHAFSIGKFANSYVSDENLCHAHL